MESFKEKLKKTYGPVVSEKIMAVAEEAWKKEHAETLKYYSTESKPMLGYSPIHYTTDPDPPVLQLNTLIQKYKTAEELVADEMFHGAWPEATALTPTVVDLYGNGDTLVEVYDEDGKCFPPCAVCGGMARKMKNLIKICGSCDAEVLCG